jgi:hypothetical protein
MGCLALILTLRYSEGDRSPGLITGLGLLSGLGAWSFPAFTPFIFVQAIIFLQARHAHKRRDFSLWFAGFLLGHLPAMHYNATHPGAQFHRMASRFLRIDREEWETSTHRIRLIASHLILKLMSVPTVVGWFPAQFARLTDWLDAIALVPAALWAWRRGRGSVAIVSLYTLAFLALHIFVAGDPYAHSLFSLYIPFMIFTAGWLADVWSRSKPLGGMLAGMLIIGNLCSLSNVLLHPEDLAIPELTAFLDAHAIDRGYSDYWIAYPTIFQSRERILLSPTLLHPTFYDRHPEYTEEVRRSPRAAFVVDRKRLPCVGPELERLLKAKGVSYEKVEIKDLSVYYDFSRPVYPEEFALGTIENCAAR